MKLFKTLFLSVFTVILLLPQVIVAETVIRTGETVSIASDQRIEGDFYVASSILNVSGQVTEDMSALGGKVTLNGSVEKDVLLIGGSIDIHGAVGEDVRAIGGDIIIAKPVVGDVFVIGSSVTILDTASIGGDLIVYGGDVIINGPVGGDIVGEVESIRIDTAVKGAVDVTADTVTVGDRADITGSLSYISQEALVRAPNAKISGEVIRSDATVAEVTAGPETFLVPVLVLLFSALVWYLIARKFLSRIVDRALVRGIRPIATGFLTLFAAPVIISVLLFSVLGTLVGLTGLFAYLFALLLSIVSGAAVVGMLTMKLLKKAPETITPVVVIVGVLVISVCALIPVFNVLALTALFMVTLGAIVDIILHP